LEPQTQIGIGAGAVFALFAALIPVIPWWASAPAMAVCAAVAIWGFSPLLNIPTRFHFGRQRANTFIPFPKAADELYSVIKNRQFGRLTRDRAPSRSEIRDAMGEILFGRGENLQGRRPREPEGISRGQKPYNRVTGGAQRLEDKGDNTTWTDLKITRGELDRIKAVAIAESDDWR
jgi:hypothetical protein